MDWFGLVVFPFEIVLCSLILFYFFLSYFLFVGVFFFIFIMFCFVLFHHVVDVVMSFG